MGGMPRETSLTSSLSPTRSVVPLLASDISHTMQHWHIYLKWNEKFFVECYNAYKEGRAENNPLDGWYKGEMGFYDFYIM